MFFDMKLHRKAIQLTPDKAPRASPSSVVFISVSSPTGFFFYLLLLGHKLLPVFSSLDHLCMFFPPKEKFPAACSPRAPGGQGKAGLRAGFGKHLPDKLNSAL